MGALPRLWAAGEAVVHVNSDVMKRLILGREVLGVCGGSSGAMPCLTPKTGVDVLLQQQQAKKKQRG